LVTLKPVDQALSDPKLPVALQRPFPIAGTMGSTPTDFTSPTEYDARSLPPFASRSEDRSAPDGASIGVRQYLITTTTSGVHSVHGIPTSHATVRPRRSSRPRRLTPPPALWVCFAPQPCTGFSLQGVSLLTEQFRVSPVGAFMPLDRPPPGLTRSTNDPRLQGLAPRESPLTSASRKADTGPVPLLGFSPPRVLTRCAVGTLSRSFRPGPSS